MLAAFALLAVGAWAQDFPTHKGDTGRTGKNSNPAAFGPGFANLTWFTPNGLNRGSAVIRNNTGTSPTPPSPLDPIVRTGTWAGPAPGVQEANPFYTAPRTLNTTLDQVRGSKVDTQTDAAAAFVGPYEYATAIQSAHGSHDDPRIPRGSGLSTFEWVLDPTVENPLTPNGAYGLYVYLPNGPTDNGTNLVYPARFFVYEVTYGTGQTSIEIVDRNIAGQGWVRLGNKGGLTNKVYPYSGQPLHVKLFNTVYRDVNDQLTEPFRLTTAGDPNSDVLFPNDKVVYADAAMAVPDNGYYVAQPTVKQINTGLGTRVQTVAALNKNISTFQGGQAVTITTPEVTAYSYDTGGVLWRWNPTEVLPFSTTVDNNAAAVGPTWTADSTTAHQGADYDFAPIDPVSVSSAVTYTPTLGDGDYLIQVYCGGNSGIQNFSKNTDIEVYEGGALPTATIPIDQSVAGWVTISNLRFRHTSSAPLRVAITNHSSNLADALLFAYADAVRFIGGYNNSINATPTQAKIWLNLNGGPRVEKDCVIVASDDGHVYCLDATGNGDGTTNVYWAYPSVITGTQTDPNLVPGEDENALGNVADMPNTGFGVSSPLVVRTDPNTDLIYVAGKNGRVYCINSDGRGDYDKAAGKVGTTTRKWSYPDDYPAIRKLPIPAGSTGVAFGGSPALATVAGNLTVIVPALEGRVYALDAIGTTNKRTTTTWTYPVLTAPAIGPVSTTPAVDFNRLYFGTARKDDTVPGQFYSLNLNGSFDWKFEQDNFVDPITTLPVTVDADHFTGGPATATAAQAGGPDDLVFASNQNGYIYALKSTDGSVIWRTNELDTGVTGALTFNVMSVPDLAGVVNPAPVVMVPTDDGRFDALFANPATLAIDGTRLAWEWTGTSDAVTSPLAVGWNFMYGADNSGNLLAWSSNATVGGLGTPPGGSTVTINDPAGQIFRNAKVKLLTLAGYQALRASETAPLTDPDVVNGDVGTLDYFQATSALYSFTRNPLAFEWGETAYFLVYDFPFKTTDPNGDPVSPPIVQFQMSVEGNSVRQFGVQAKRFKQPPNAPNGWNGYAILAFPIQGSGPTSLPPGGARIQFTIQSAALNNSGTVQNVRLNPATSSTRFLVANPLALYMPEVDLTGKPTGNIGGSNRRIGDSTNPGDPQRITEGSPNTVGVNGTLLGNSAGVVGNGQSGTANFWVADMSMLTILKGAGRGLESVRLSRPELAWQGGPGEIYKAIDATIYPGYEDLPARFPNLSLDYPNIPREYLRAVKDPNGVPENPMVSTSGVSLEPPILPPNYDESMLQLRVISPVLFQLTVDVPRFQPPNNRNNYAATAGIDDPYFTESGLSKIPSGYLGRINVFVDANGDGIFNPINGRREAYRSFTFNTAVAVDERFSVTTPTVDLGALAQGTGYSPLAPGTFDPSALSPWTAAPGTSIAGFTSTPNVTANPDYAALFRSFTVVNEGNVNFLNLRLAKGVAGGPFPGAWPLYANSVDDLGWLDASRFVWSDMDYTFGLLPNTSLLQKARVGDRGGTTFSPNPIYRENGNLGITRGILFPNGPEPANPRIAATPPIGQPVGLYSQRMEIVEDLSPFNQAVDVDGGNNPLEIISNPTFILKFIVRESRATTSFTKATTQMIDVPPTYAAGSDQSQQLTYANLQPAGMRTPNGDVVMVWTSDRPQFNANHPTDQVTDAPYRLYVSTLNGIQPGGSAGTSPLRELGDFIPASNARWFRQEVGPFPPAPFDPYFNASPTATLIPNSVKFGAPSLPSNGMMDPLGGAPFSTVTMAFIGTAQKQTTDGRATEYRLMTARLAVDAAGAVTADNVQSMTYDVNTPKSKPTIYQVPGGSVIFYTATGTGEGQLFYTVFDGTTFTQPKSVSVGSGFEALSAPSVVVRPYTGNGGNQTIIELGIVGKLRGRTNSEVFYGRMSTQGTTVGSSTITAPNTPLFLPARTQEVVVAESERGTYRAGGVVWNSRFATKVYQRLNNVVVDLELPNTRSVDRASGLIRFDSKLGGAIYLDPNLGTVRFGTSVPVRSAQILLDYQPRFLRASESTISGSNSATLLWDNRSGGDVSATSYWFDVVGGNISNVNPSTALPRPARYLFTYTRAASGAGAAARPYIRTLRLGVQLPSAIHTQDNGNITGLTISSASGPVQVDPANGRIYFPAGDEDRTVNISYTGIDEGTGAPIINPSTAYTVGIVSERAEQPVRIDQAINESGVSPFIDPFDSTVTLRRPGLVWMFFVSTRAGGPDIYFQTIAPRFNPVIKAK